MGGAKGSTVEGSRVVLRGALGERHGVLIILRGALGWSTVEGCGALWSTVRILRGAVRERRGAVWGSTVEGVFWRGGALWRAVGLT